MGYTASVKIFDGQLSRSNVPSKYWFDSKWVRQKIRRNHSDEMSVRQKRRSGKLRRNVSPSNTVRQNFRRICQKNHFNEAFFDWHSFRQNCRQKLNFFPSKKYVQPV